MRADKLNAQTTAKHIRQVLDNVPEGYGCQMALKSLLRPVWSGTKTAEHTPGWFPGLDRLSIAHEFPPLQA